MSIDYMERQMKRLQMPEINVQDQVMKRLDNSTMKQTYRVRNNRVILAVIVLLLLLGTGFASVTFINLYDKEGSLSFSIKGFDKDNPAPVLTQELSKKYLELIKPGEAIVVYNPVGNPGNIVSSLQKPIEIYSLEELRQQAGSLYHIPEELPNYVVFKSGVLHHELEDPDIQHLISKSQASNGDVVSEKVDFKNEVHGVTMKFIVKGNEYSASQYQGSRWNTVYTDLKDKKDLRVIQVRNSDGLLMLDEGRTILMWRSEKEQGEAFYYLSTKGLPSNTESQLVSLLELLIP